MFDDMLKVINVSDGKLLQIAMDRRYGRILVKNDSQDSNYNVLEVSGGGGSYSLKPGESQILPRGTSTIYFSRQYRDYSRSYTVECPDIVGSGIRIKLIDVHVNRIAGGCKTVSASKG